MQDVRFINIFWLHQYILFNIIGENQMWEERKHICVSSETAVFSGSLLQLDE